MGLATIPKHRRCEIQQHVEIIHSILSRIRHAHLKFSNSLVYFMRTTSKATAHSTPRRYGGLERLSSSDMHGGPFYIVQKAWRWRGGRFERCKITGACNSVVLFRVWGGRGSVCIKERQDLWSRRQVAGLHKAGRNGVGASGKPTDCQAHIAGLLTRTWTWP